MEFDNLSKGWHLNKLDLNGKLAVVTGATGILGKWFSAALADHGANLILIDIDEFAVSNLAQWLSDRFNVKVFSYALDISDPQAVAQLAYDIEIKHGRIDILHNNAATKGKSLEDFFESAEKYSPAVWREIMAVNLDAAFFVAREFGGRMAKAGGGSIIQTASIYGIMGPDQRIYEGSEYMGRPINTPAVYSASKAAIVGLTKYFSTYWGNSGVRVNTLTPGGVSSGQNETFDNRYSYRVPLGRMATAADMTGALIFLASDASSYITGQNIIVDGGLSAW